MTRKTLDKLFLLFSACLNGIWLGILNRETMHLIDEYYYDNQKMYQWEEYNRAGLWGWEKKVINEYFEKCKSLLVLGAGGGREVLALSKLGYEVDGCECNPQLVKFGNQLIEKEGLTSNIQLIERDSSLENGKLYDGIIVGWGAYMLIQGRERRIAFLKNLRNQMNENSPILLSFFSQSGNNLYFKIVHKISNTLRWISRKNSSEFGDDLVPNFVHYFNEEEIANELKEGGFKLEMYSTNEYGHAVGIAN
ncbi:MAG: SAM-dependent methyltransferase [Richelia sp. RM2_1_2]|nr:SAM-dependent methyltransferase [Richelia sp. RM2_1_2]